jgi:putative endopeptidase
MKYFFYFALIAFISVSCSKEKTPEQHKVVFDGIDDTVRPGDDFFNHVNKTWYEAAVIAEDQVGIGAYRYLNIPQKKLLQNRFN